jgi:hypothetical protein
VFHEGRLIVDLSQIRQEAGDRTLPSAPICNRMEVCCAGVPLQSLLEAAVLPPVLFVDPV